MAYDVFISFKNTAPGGGLTVDRTIAERLHIRLRDEGLNVFFSEKDLSTSAFMDEIYQALDEADLLILVGTSAEYINSRWVKSEWSTFFGSIQSGRKPHGDIITVLQDISTRDLPIQLEHFESFSAKDIDGAVDFAFKTLGKIKKSEAAARIAEEQERKRREAEEAAILEMRKRMEAEKAAELEKQRQEAEKARQERLRKAAEAKAQREKQRREAAEERAARSERTLGKQASQNRLLKVVAVVVCAALLIGGVFGISAYSRAKQEAAEAARIAEELRIAEEERIKAEEERLEAERIKAEENFEKNFEYRSVDGGIEITGYHGTDFAVTIPNEYNGEPIVSIGESAFSNKSYITAISLPDSLTSIGAHSFYGSTNIATIIVPDSVTCIGKNAFGPHYTEPFYYITDELKCVTVLALYPASYYNYTVEAGDLVSWGRKAVDPKTDSDRLAAESLEFYYGDGYMELARVKVQTVDHIDIPREYNGYPVTAILDSAFEDCNSLISITIPDTITTIGDYSFSSCRKLNSVYIPNSVTSIGKGIFQNCDNLVSINIPDSVTAIGDFAFFSCDNLNSVDIPNSVTSIGKFAFNSCNSLDSIVIPESVESIGKNAFSRYTTTITAPHGASYYGYEPYNSTTWIVE